jgi:cell wall-associated NlpC family hydrolase
MKILGVIAAAAAVTCSAVVIVGIAVISALAGALHAATSPAPASAAAIADIPAAMLSLYRQAGANICPQMPWQIIAAIGTVETANGTSTLPGVHTGHNFAGAEGPMQFEPATFTAYDQPVPPGGTNPPNMYDPPDAVYAAARMLCANGGATGDPQAAIFAYNHSETYLSQVWALALSYGMAADGSPHAGPPTNNAPPPGATVTGDPRLVLAFALSQLGVPYQWGGTTPGVGLDCSGLAMLSYQAAGITLPRTTYNQVKYGITVPADQLSPADLLFFNDGTDYGHVAIYLGHGLMIQAPYTGTTVSIAPVNPATIELARRIIINP